MEYGLVALWLLAFLALLYIGMPLAKALLPRLEDAGAGVALPLALAVVWTVAYLVGHLSITVGLWLGVATLALGAAGLYYRGYEIDNRAFAEAAVVFTVAFLFVILIRAFDPAAQPGGGEKFLDMGLLQSLLRGTTIPPEDAWFAGETVRYYYGGHYLASLLARLTGTEARFAYNLALAGFYGMLVTGVYGVAGSLAASRGFSRRRAAVVGAFFVGFASNLHTAARLGLGLLPDGLQTTVAETLGVTVEGVSTGLSGFSYWSASRIIPGTINEFPLFAWLNGDLHAHMMNSAFLVLVAAVLADLYLSGGADSRRRSLLVLFGVLPALAGMVAVVSTWAFPTVGGLVAVTLVLAPVSPAALLSPRLADRVRYLHPVAREVLRVLLAVAVGGLVLALGWLWSAPYWLFVASSTSSPAVLPGRSSLGGLVVVHGAFLVLFWLYLYRHLLPSVPAVHRGTAGPLFIAGSALLLAVSVALDAAAVGLFVPLILLGWLVLRRTAPRDGLLASPDTEATPASDGGAAATRPGFEAVLVVAVAGLLLMVEFVFVADIIAPERLNTVFKVYAQVWPLAAIAAGVVATRLVAERAPDLALSSARWQQAFSVVVALVLVATSLYGVLAMSEHVTETGRPAEDLTLDSLAFVEERHGDEAGAINYLLTEVEGQPNMVSDPNNGGPGEGYTWGNAPASLTGVPTLVGWWPERGYRGHDVYEQRVDHVEQIFTGSPQRQRLLLGAYNVELVYVGPNERAEYTPITVTELDAVTPIDTWGSVTIYRVDQTDLSE